MLKRIGKIDRAAATPQQVSMSYNNVKSLAPLAARKRPRALCAAYNNIDKLREIDRLRQLPNPEDIAPIGNPNMIDLTQEGTYRNEMVERLKKLQVLDGASGINRDADAGGRGGGASAAAGNASGNRSRGESPGRLSRRAEARTIRH